MLRQRTSVQMLEQLQKRTDHIRNVCILAHVDHGKTTLADSLVASNGIISQRMAGKLRYMDSRVDEQERGITMKSSAISLHCNFDSEDYLINLIDSPGHVDFTSEVTTAIRLCDSVIVIVDVVEGVCAQTRVALELAYKEQLHPVLVLNKIDRLILEKKMTALDAYVHLVQILEQVNAVTGEMFTKTALEKFGVQENVEKDVGVDKVFDWDAGLEDIDDSNLYFSPLDGNVVFTSATDGWGFAIEDFAKIYSEKLGVRYEILRKTLWGDYYLNMKAKKIQKGAQAKAKKPLFAQLVLQGIFDVYETVCVNKNDSDLEKMCTSLGIKLQARDMRQTDTKVKVSAMLNAWLPLSRAVLRMLIGLPPPTSMSPEKVAHLLRTVGDQPAEVELLKKALAEGSPAEDAPVIVFVSKMFAVETSQLPENRPKQLSVEEMSSRRADARKRLEERLKKADESEINGTPVVEDIVAATSEIEEKMSFVGFARVFSGTLKRGSQVFVLGPKHNPAEFEERNPSLQVEESLTIRDLKSDCHVTKVTLDKLYLMMGRELAEIGEVPAGNILGIGGLLENHVAKYATLCSNVLCPPFTDMSSPVVPILRVALEPAKLADMSKLVEGMKLLHQSDPCVQIILQESGEHVLVTAGEVHLERCLTDLRELFAKIPLVVSEPIVPFRESIVEPPKTDMVNEIIDTANRLTINEDDDKSLNSDRSVTIFTPSKQCSITVKALPLPEPVVSLIDGEASLLKEFEAMKASEQEIAGELSEDLKSRLNGFKKKLDEQFSLSDMQIWKDFDAERIWSFGPKKFGPNILVNNVKDSNATFWQCASKNNSEQQTLENNLVSGFQLASNSGPICEEPLRSVAFLLCGWQFHEQEEKNSPYGPLSGQLMSTMKDCCRRAFQAQPQRLMAAMYECNIQVTAEALRKMYSVVNRRNGRILAGDQVEGSSSFEVTAHIPVIESLRLAHELRTQTSGLAQPQLIFSHWEIIDLDPYWVPRTEEELLHFGEKADSANRAMLYMNRVRRRKGLKVNEHVVEHAEKQRTLSKKK